MPIHKKKKAKCHHEKWLSLFQETFSLSCRRPGGATAAEVRRVAVEPFGQPVNARVQPDATH
jgi:hypothetical protein